MSNKKLRLPMNQVMDSIKGMFVNLPQYRKYIIENNLEAQGYPLHPESYYKEYPGVDTFLGNTYGTYAYWQSNDCRRRQLWRLGRLTIDEQKKTYAQVPSKLPPVELYKQLLAHNVSSNTLKSFLDDIKPTMNEMRELVDALMEHSTRMNKIKV